MTGVREPVSDLYETQKNHFEIYGENDIDNLKDQA